MIKNCLKCNKEFEKSIFCSKKEWKTRKFCSHSCANSVNKNGKLFVKGQKYGTVGGDLVVHHVNNWAEYPDIRLAIDNGITLSKKAHMEFHKKYGMKHCIEEQLLEFLSVEEA